MAHQLPNLRRPPLDHFAVTLRPGRRREPTWRGHDAARGGLSKNGNVQLTCDYNDKSGVLRMVAERMLQHQREGTVDSYTLVPYVMQLPSAS